MNDGDQDALAYWPLLRKTCVQALPLWCGAWHFSLSPQLFENLAISEMFVICISAAVAVDFSLWAKQVLTSLWDLHLTREQLPMWELQGSWSTPQVERAAPFAVPSAKKERSAQIGGGHLPRRSGGTRAELPSSSCSVTALLWGCGRTAVSWPVPLADSEGEHVFPQLAPCHGSGAEPAASLRFWSQPVLNFEGLSAQSLPLSLFLHRRRHRPCRAKGKEGTGPEVVSPASCWAQTVSIWLLISSQAPSPSLPSPSTSVVFRLGGVLKSGGFSFSWVDRGSQLGCLLCGWIPRWAGWVVPARAVQSRRWTFWSITHPWWLQPDLLEKNSIWDLMNWFVDLLTCQQKHIMENAERGGGEIF